MEEKKERFKPLLVEAFGEPNIQIIDTTTKKRFKGFVGICDKLNEQAREIEKLKEQLEVETNAKRALRSTLQVKDKYIEDLKQKNEDLKQKIDKFEDDPKNEDWRKNFIFVDETSAFANPPATALQKIIDKYENKTPAIDELEKVKRFCERSFIFEGWVPKILLIKQLDSQIEELKKND